MAVLDRFRLDGKVAVVTGASSGLGVHFSQALAQAGADVAMGARRVERMAETVALVEAEGRRAVSVATDVSKPEDCQALVAAAVETFGRVDILVNNAGVGTAGPASREAPEDFRRVIDINLMGTYWMAQAAQKAMQPGSTIINISSVLGLVRSHLPQAAYAASKAGVIGLTRDLANQWTHRKGIRVNALAPGYFASEMTDEMKAANLDLDAFVRVAVPMQRIGASEELCAALIFLASDASTYITGVTLPVDGGMVMP